MSEITITRFANRLNPAKYINNEAGNLTVGLIQRDWLSAQWQIEPVPGTSYVRFKNLSKPDNYLHIEGGIPEAGPIEPGWLSSQWQSIVVQGTAFVRIRNRLPQVRYAHIESGQIDAGHVEPGWLSAQWLLEQVQGTSFVRIRSRWKPDHGLHIESGVLSAGPVAPGMLSGQWSMEKVAGTSFFRFKNRWKPDQYFHIESGRTEAGPVQQGWLSAQWLLEPVPGTAFVWLRNRWELDRYLHIERGILEAGPIEPGWLSAQWLTGMSMPVASLGEPLTGVYSVQGGDARLFERGMIVNGAGGRVVVSFAFPMIGRPSIVTGDPAKTRLFEDSVINFQSGKWQLEQIVPLIQNALAGRLVLVPTGQPAIPVPLIIGPETIDQSGDYGIMVTVSTLQERQLYDVAIIADGNQWRIAPHAVYYRRTWTDFGIAHITDIHVARRIDQFRKLLSQAGRAEAAQRMYNWNDRFRGFVRYANYLHGIGALDVILATGDLYDYIYEDDDDPIGGGNAEFFRKLILGQAPGPDFPDVEELLVPIFMVPGNHDYRKHPYKLIFDIHFGGTALGMHLGIDIERITNFSGYHLLRQDAIVLGNRLDGRSSPFELIGGGVPNVGVDGAERMVEVDPEIKAYKAFLADRGSYVVRLGAHRIAMLDSAHDVGMITGIMDGLRIRFGNASEDEKTFVGGSPNCEGISSEELAMVSDALAETPDGGLFILGVHAPLFNLWNNEYPYFLRRTQRPAQRGQDHAFLARIRPLLKKNIKIIEKAVEASHPLWFAGEHDHSAPRFVKRVDSQDLLDYGVSRGNAEALIQLLAGVGSHRPADVVLAGHTHHHNEFIVRTMQTGELAFYMDYYAQNPVNYYPTRFTRGWEDIVGAKVPETDVTYVEIAEDAPPDAAPQPLPYDTMYNYQLQVPPYPNPLSSSPDPRAWWSEHRPLVLQTGALGPLENSQISFTGFRILSVKNDVIDRIHFISTAKLETNQYRLAWEEAIRPDPPFKPGFKEAAPRQ
ncbi:RICIN domain-containing protein [Desulfococcus multivorans]|nr:metallophosphoesterase [Desulfococcus multivorans]AOY57244.1 uncharacterized protein Dmul_04690 [Desulfococcus multivorans]AQU99705.1 hypothetical protein B2D07_02200 [Desulfococcus multivorans]SKA27154.1 Calcineurin-like phosphoesterase [Desulfococcus multivorans DSM 2059]